MATLGTFTAGQVLTAAELNDIGTWSTWTPVVTQPGTITATVTYAKYTVLNDIVIAQTRLDITGTGTGGNGIAVSLPVNGNATSGLRTGSGSFFDSSTNTSYAMITFSPDGTKVNFVSDATGFDFFGATPNIALGANDQIAFTVVYEVA